MKTLLLLSLILMSNYISAQSDSCDCINGVLPGDIQHVTDKTTGKNYVFFSIYKGEDLCIKTTYARQDWPTIKADFFSKIKQHEVYRNLTFNSDFGNGDGLHNTFNGLTSQKGIDEVRAQVNNSPERFGGIFEITGVNFQSALSSYITCTEKNKSTKSSTTSNTLQTSESSTDSRANENSNNNSSSNSNSVDIYNQKMQETNDEIERIDKNFNDLSEQLTSSFDNIRASMAKEKDFQNKVSSLTSIQATDASSIISEARKKSRELDVAFDQKSADAYNEINKIGTDLAGSAKNNEQLILSGGLTIGMHILSQNNVEKARQEAKRQLEAEKERELQKIANELISKYSKPRTQYLERAKLSVLKDEEDYYLAQYDYCNCMIENARQIIVDEFECEKLKMNKPIVKKYFSGQEYFDAFKRKLENELFQSKTEIFLNKDLENILDLAIEKEPKNAEWIFEKMRTNLNTTQRLSLFKYYSENGTSPDRFTNYDGYLSYYQECLEKAKKMNANFEWDKHNGLMKVEFAGSSIGYCDKKGLIKIEDNYGFASDFTNGKAVVKSRVNNDYWLISTNANKLKKLNYLNISDFSDGLALVSKLDVEANSSLGLTIDTSNIEIVKTLAIKKFGYIDQNGDLKIPIIYAVAEHFSDGLARVKVDFTEDKMIFINKSGMTVLDGVNAGSSFIGGKSFSFHKNAWWIINKKGEYLVKTKHKQKPIILNENIYLFSRGSNFGNFGIADFNGTILVEPTFDEICKYPHNGYYAAWKGKYDKTVYSLIDSNGKMVDLQEYVSNNKIEDGKIEIITPKWKTEDAIVRYIDVNGKIVR